MVAGDLGNYDAGVAARADADKLDDVLAMERDVRAYDPRIDNSQGSNVYDATATTALANSRGFAGQFKSSSVTRSTSPVAQDGAAKRTASYGTARRGYAGLESAGDRRAQGWGTRHRSLRRAQTADDARPDHPGARRCRGLFERIVRRGERRERRDRKLLSRRAPRRAHRQRPGYHRRRRHAVRRHGQRAVRRGGGSDAATVVFDRGVLRSFLYDTYYARKLGAASTGNAAGGSIGPTNFTLAPGTGSLDDLIAATPRGILILDTIGFATEYVTGTYSRGAAGLYIEGGEVAYPVEEFTIAGNVRDMLAAVDAVAGDLVLDGPVSSPSFRIAEMTVSGV